MDNINLELLLEGMKVSCYLQEQFILKFKDLKYVSVFTFSTFSVLIRLLIGLRVYTDFMGINVS
jgi:hypothetical protein